MTPQQIDMVRTTWQQVMTVSDAAAEMFYARLFALDPSVKPLFNRDMKQQGKKLMAMINSVVVSLDRLEKIVPVVQDLARRHAGYGVQPRHYDSVGAALLWTLERGLGPVFTADTKQAWSEAYGVLADTMKQAAA